MAFIRQTTLLVFFGLSLFALPGCGGEKLSKVSGKVTFNNKIVTGGMVVFANKENTKIARGPIQADGTYVATGVPYGQILVGVEPAPKSSASFMPKNAGVDKVKAEENNPAAQKAAQMYAKKEGSDYVNIPANLRDPTTSNITVYVDSSEKVFPIDLK